MRALVVVGSDLTQNTSANLCHRAYVQGLARHGCAVDVLTVGTDRSQFRFGLSNVREFYYPMESLYERLSNFRRKKNGRNCNGGAARRGHYQPKWRSAAPCQALRPYPVRTLRGISRMGKEGAAIYADLRI